MKGFSIKAFILRNIYPISIVALGIVICAANYTPGAYLSGWDTLHPEFNFAEYFKRIFFGAWQEHQGLGALATQSHAGELPRILMYYPLSFLLPESLLRYSTFFIALLIGPLGAYYFSLRTFLKDKKFAKQSAFGASLFYLFNLATLQHFYVPLEMFAVHYATLPWLFLYAVEFLEEKKPKTLLLFSLWTFFSAPISHTATLWHAYFVGFSLFIIFYSLLKRQKSFFKNSILLIVVTVLINSFWLFPHLYFVKTASQEVINSKIHSLFSEEAFSQNASFGTPSDLLIFRNFLFNWGEYGTRGEFVKLLDEWIDHLDNKPVLFLGYFFSVIALLGIITAIKRRSILLISLLPVLFLCVFFWMNINPPLGFIFSLIQENEIFKEALRFPFTKFSIILVFLSSVFFSAGVSLILDLVSRIDKKSYIAGLLPFILFLGFSFYMFPAFKGYLISPSMRVEIPNEYKALFEWFRENPQARVATLPIHSFWGWSYYNWGYQGAGFLWFGIPNPLLDREFDRWNPKNEQYFREMSQAVYSENQEEFNAVLNKYDVGYIVLDKNIIAPGLGVNPKVLFENEIGELLSKTPGLTKEKEFGSIVVYKKKDLPSNVYNLENPQVISPSSGSFETDSVYLTGGNYISQSGGAYFPFRDMIDNHNKVKTLNKTQEGVVYNFPGNEYLLPFLESENYAFADILAEFNSGRLSIKFLINSASGEQVDSINFETNTGRSKDLILSVNETSNFLLKDLTNNTPSHIGRALLNTNKNNNIYLYPEAEFEAKDLLLSNYSLNNCGIIEGKTSFGIEPGNNGFSLFGNNSQSCLSVPLKDLISQSDSQLLLGMGFEQDYSQNSNVCVFKRSEGKCLTYLSENLGDNGFLSLHHLGISAAEIGDLELRIFLDTTKLSDPKKVSFSNFRISTSIPSNQLSIQPSDFENLKSTKTVSTSRLLFPYSGNNKLSEDITSLPKSGAPCPKINPREGLPSNKEIVREQKDGFIRYSSSEGSFCDHFSYPSLPHNLGYILAITSRNLEGLPIRLCVTNDFSKRCDVYAHLNKSKEFSTDYFLIPPTDSGSGYDVNLNNFAIFRYPSVNDVSSIEIIPFPYSWASLIHSGDLREGNIRTIASSAKINPSLYTASTNKSGVLVLSQSFNKGWLAYEASGIIGKLFPFAGEKLTNHVLVNGWANGWVIDGGSEKNITMVYWPQYLEYLGLILVISTFTVLTIRAFKPKGRI